MKEHKSDMLTFMGLNVGSCLFDCLLLFNLANRKESNYCYYTYYFKKYLPYLI
jgi:hypothetical protein